MEVTGVPVDREVLRSIAAGLAEEVASLETTIHDLAGEPFKINSVPQLRTVLYDHLGLVPSRKTKTGFSTDARTLELLRGQHPIVEALLRYREVEKLRSTYGESLAAEVAPDGRIHATFRQTVARTGRLSSDRPNLHNIPVRTEEGRRFREAFVPSPGRRLLVADYDQVELRAIAHLTGDPGLTAAFAAGEDIHRTVASRVFGIERDEVSHAQRSTAKMVSYGLAYGMEAYGLSQRLGVPVEEAQVILQAFFDGFPSVNAYMDRAVAEARRADGGPDPAGAVESLAAADTVLHFLRPARVGPVEARCRVFGGPTGRALVRVAVHDVGADDRLVALGSVVVLAL